MPTSFNLLVEHIFLCKKRMLRSNISTVQYLQRKPMFIGATPNDFW